MYLVPCYYGVVVAAGVSEPGVRRVALPEVAPVQTAQRTAPLRDRNLVRLERQHY